MSQVTAGTAADGFRAVPVEHVFERPAVADFGWRPACARCGREQAAHIEIPTPRKGE